MNGRTSDLRPKHLHFMGIGGVSMQALARWFALEGFRVSGCDQNEAEALNGLRSIGIEVASGHDAQHINSSVDELIVTMAIPHDHPEVLAAHERGVRVRHRIELLGELFERRRAIGVSGTHGKSTTSGMIAHVLMAAGVDPSIQLGASLPGLEGNMRHGAGDWLVAEVDESDPGFANLKCDIGILTNLEDDHIAGEFDERRNYHATLADLEQAARRFASSAQQLVYCSDWPDLKRLVGDHPRALSYGFEPGAGLCLHDLNLMAGGSQFTLELPDRTLLPVVLQVPGRHNALNATACVAALSLAGLAPQRVAELLYGFRGVGRRWQVWGERAGALVVDDYAHHPTEIHATLSAACASGRRVRAVLQPHRWVRTARMWPAIADAAALADEVLLLDIYAAGEAPIAGVGVDLILERLHAAGVNAAHHTIDSAARYLSESLEGGDLILTLGAGDVWRVAEALTRTQPEPS
jgi:UDP-N-acetylmuramate--alanine ligase